MNLVGTLAKMAVGVMVSRGVGKMMGGSRGGGGLGGLLGGLAGGAARSGGGGLAGMLGSALSGGGGASGGLGGLLGSLGGGGQAQGGAQAGGGLGNSGVGGLLNQMMAGESTQQPTAEQNSQAEIMLRAMINSAKSDGGVDETEQRKILEHLGDDVGQEEIAFVKNEMAAPLDVNGFINSVPKGMEQQVYVMSLLAIDLDTQAEAQYLDQLAKGMGISNELSNQIHEKVGVPALYG